MQPVRVSLLLFLFTFLTGFHGTWLCWGSDSMVLKKTLRLSEEPLHLDFVVPEGAREIAIWLEYPEGGHELEEWGATSARLVAPNDAFRGRSTGWAEPIFLSEEEASPGFIPGSLTSGTWRLVLSNRTKVDVRCDIEVRLRIGQALPPRGARWLRGDFHTHNEHADGAFSLSTLVSRFRAAKLDFAVITEHNTSSHHREIAALPFKTFLLIMGEEITTPFGHANALGLAQGAWIDFRIDGSPASLENIINQTHQAGALFSINHPYLPTRYPESCCLWKMETPEGIDCIEVWNGGDNDESDEKALAWWDSLLAKGRTITAIGGSDAHFRAGVKWIGKEDRGRSGRPTTWVLADSLETSSILEAVRSGRVFIAARPDVSPLTFTLTDSESGQQAGIGDTLHVSGEKMELEVQFNHPSPVKIRAIGQGKVLAEQVRTPGAPSLKISLPPTGSYVRVEIVEHGTGTMLVLTNPIRIQTRQGR